VKGEAAFPWLCVTPAFFLLALFLLPVLQGLFSFFTDPLGRRQQAAEWVTFTCTRCRHVERHRDEDLDWTHAAAAVCPRCGGQQTIS
jgi:Zn ribbon nucleic-acid-binding protein